MFRIRRIDQYSWGLEFWVTDSIDQKTGKPAKDHWKIVGYYDKLSDLVIYLVDKSIQVPEGTIENQVKDLIAEIKRVEKSILNQLEAEYLPDEDAGRFPL